jgi:geranylgeranyl reductase family protein
MDSYDAVIVGGGPAGSSCAWELRRSGLKVAIVDRQVFPRNKVCGGWITPAVFKELEIEPAEYGQGRLLQPITGFRTSHMGGREVETHFGKPVSYGIRRFEFDNYLLQRSGATLRLGQPLTSLERSGAGWIVNNQLRSPMLVGAGGTFCPVARFLGAKVSREFVVTAQEAEFDMDQGQLSHCSIRGETPELYFCSDMKGYGWCFRKHNVLNVGLGRLDRRSLSSHVSGFLNFLKATRKLSPDLPSALPGHAYLLFSQTTRKPVDEGVLLIGDAAGVSYAQSGEGIRPAVESGLLAARVIADAQGNYSRRRLDPYGDLLSKRFGGADSNWIERIGQRVPGSLVNPVARRLLETGWFAREVVLKNWFLRQHEVPLRV